jgi:DNA polymerase
VCSSDLHEPFGAVVNRALPGGGLDVELERARPPREHAKRRGQVLDDFLAQKAINTYRTKHHFVPSAWSNFQKAAELTVAQRKYKCAVNHVTFARGERGAMTMELPSGRKLYYHGLTLKETTGFMGEPRNELVYLGVSPKTKQWSEIKTRGPTLVENAVQAIARDLMAAAMLRLTAAGFRVVLTVHDEILAEHEESDRLEVFIKTMAAVPTWAKGLPIGVDGWKGERYRK